jgi:glycine cleavage system pyridoxal-binding protein P
VQHIFKREKKKKKKKKREKATSNICTAQALLANIPAM